MITLSNKPVLIWLHSGNVVQFGDLVKIKCHLKELFFVVIRYFVVFIKNFKTKLTVYHGSAAALLILMTLLRGELALLSSKSLGKAQFFFHHMGGHPEHLMVFVQGLGKEVSKTVAELYRSFSRAAALVPTAEANVCCEELCTKILSVEGDWNSKVGNCSNRHELNCNNL